MRLAWLSSGRNSFGEKVVALATFVSGIAILLVAVVLGANDYRQSRRSEIAGVAAQASIVAMNSSAPLAFGDRASAEEALGALSAAPNVASATLYDGAGERFASYARRGQAAPEFRPEPPGLRSEGGWMVQVAPVAERGETLGQLVVVFELSQTWERLATTLLTAAGAALAAMALVFFLARKLEDVLVRPIRALGATARRISETRNYALRAARHDDDEIGELTDQFNAMLGEIEKQNTQISAARGEAERLSQLKDEFLATLSHELRTPLTPILGWVQILRRTGVDDPQVRQAVDVIERNVRNQAQLVNDLLDMSRIISGKVRLDLAPIDLADLIRAALDTVEPTAAARGVHLLSSLDPDTGKVRGDAGRLQQVVWNLLTNAIKFTPADGRVQVTLRRGGDNALISISDTGQGISPEFLPHVFERFRQADSSTTREHGGLGIGLALVRQLVEMHAGTVRADSPGRGEGATFTVELPLLGHEPLDAALRSSLPVPPESQAPAPSPDALLGLRVLVVDDEDDTRQMFARMLGAAGAQVTAVGSARDAMREFERQPPDLLLSDIGMPETDGYWLIEAVRRLPPGAGGSVPAIAVTAFARGSDRSRALGAGYQMHLAKPIGQAELVGALSVLARR